MANFDALKESPEEKALQVPLAGGEFPWLPTVAAAERAEAQGHKLGTILDGLQALEALEGASPDADVADVINDLAGGMQALSQLVWYGFLTFDSIALSDVQQHITQQSIAALPVREMMQAIFPSGDETAPEEAGKATGDGPGSQ